MIGFAKVYNTNWKKLSKFYLVYHRLVFSRFFDIRGNLGSVKEKQTRKTCFSQEKKSLALRIYQAKFCLAAFL